MFFGQTLRYSLFLCSLCQKTKASIFPMQKHIHTKTILKRKAKRHCHRHKGPRALWDLDPINNFSSKQKPQKNFEFLVKLQPGLISYQQYQQIQALNLTNWCYNFNKFMLQILHQQNGFCFVLASTTYFFVPASKPCFFTSINNMASVLFWHQQQRQPLHEILSSNTRAFTCQGDISKVNNITGWLSDWVW